MAVKGDDRTVVGSGEAEDAEEADEEDARLVKHLCQVIDARPWIRPAQ